MAGNRATQTAVPSLFDAQVARVADQGSAAHPHCRALRDATGAHVARDLADAVHLLCAIHGKLPGLTEIALTNCPAGPVRDWLGAAADAFERERLYLVRLTAAVGPLPSTPGAAQTENALLAQRHALETLARSERQGCAIGAATALVQDWPAIRALLDRAAGRCSVEWPQPTLPGETSIAEAISAGTGTPASERALAFGAEQMLLQHRALLDLLEARAEARDRL